VLGNAADFFMLHDRAQSEFLLLKAQALDGGNPRWPERLARLHSLGKSKRPQAERREAAVQAFAELERAYGLESEELKRFWKLPDLAEAAFEAGEVAKARAYASEVLSKSERPGFFYHQDGMAVHYGHLVLGRLALRDGDMEKAKWHLLESGKTKGSPTLSSGGPRMALAKELLDRGERAAVVEFLRLCTAFWKTDDHRPEQWAYAIEHGKTPDFRFNL